jgi:plastocyanin
MLSRRKFSQYLAGSVASLTCGAGQSFADDSSSINTHNVTIKGFKFEPEQLVIKTDDIVVWTNEDVAPHTASAKQADWSTKNLKKGESGEIQFLEAGKFDYFCRFHPNMVAQIIVE